MELATSIKHDGVLYEEGTPLSKLPKEVQDLAKKEGLVKVSIAQMKEFDALYDKAVELNLIGIPRDQLATAVSEAGGTKAQEMALADEQLAKSASKASEEKAEAPTTEAKTSPGGTAKK